MFELRKSLVVDHSWKKAVYTRGKAYGVCLVLEMCSIGWHKEVMRPYVGAEYLYQTRFSHLNCFSLEFSGTRFTTSSVF